jgi:hypothetical protein
MLVRGNPEGRQDLWLIQRVGPAPPWTLSPRVGIRNEPGTDLELPTHDGVEAGHALEERTFCHGT